MTFARRIPLVLARYFYRLTLFLGLSLLAVVIVFGNSETIKRVLAETNTYPRIADASISAAQSKSKTQNAIPFENPEVQNIIRKTISPQLMQSQTEAVIDGIYAWLKGDSPSPSFALDSLQPKQQLAADLSNYAASRLESLPVCRSIPAEQNVYELTCRPPNIDIDQEKNKLQTAILESDAVMADRTIDANDLVQNQEGQSFDQVYGDVPAYYQWLNRAPYMLLALSVIFAVAIAVFNQRRLAGVRSIGLSTLGTGIALLVAPVLYSLLSVRIRNYIAQTTSGDTTGISADVFTTLYGELNSALLKIAIITAIFGAVMALAAYLRLKSESKNSLVPS